MNREDYDNIVNFINKKGGNKEKKSIKRLMQTQGYDMTHACKQKIQKLNKKIGCLQEMLSIIYMCSNKKLRIMIEEFYKKEIEEIVK
jgi:hypothetical protein